MFAPDQYQLLDFGDGRKLERFGPYVLDRPSPAAEGAVRMSPELWSTAAARFVRRPGPAEEGCWETRRPFAESWAVVHGSLTFTVRPTPFGHVGVFPEQAENWDWIRRYAQDVKVLNLFAYTGGSTLAAAAVGAEVVHIDAARSVVAWARKNAAQTNLSDAPIRWIVEDAQKFVTRELRRGNRYDAVILDPPTYGHGAKGEIWTIDEHLAPLLANCARLTDGRQAFFLLSCHSPGWGPEELAAALVQAGVAHSLSEIDARPLSLVATDGRTLPSGAAARWPREFESQSSRNVTS